MNELRETYLKLSGEEKVSGRWGEPRLRQEIEKLQNPDVPEEAGEKADVPLIKKEEPPAEEVKFQFNVNPNADIKPKKGDGNYCIVLLTDGGALKEGLPSSDPYQQNSGPVKRIARYSPDNFWRMFSSHFTANGRFVNVNDTNTLIRLFLNLTPEIIENTIKFELSKTKNAEQYDNVMNYYIKEFSILKLNGSNQGVLKEDIIHIPGITDIDKFPEECVRTYKYAK